MNSGLPLQEFLKHPGALFDVRSEAEYQKGHIPNSLNLPLFNNAERAEVGTCYKKTGPKEAFLIGLKLAQCKFASFVEFAHAHSKEGKCKVLCWRGGLRSGSIAWLFNAAGISAVTLKGGYKAFRRWVLEQFETPYELKILGGLTGSGKTALLKKFRENGEQIIDLESLAAHRGSAFGSLGLSQQHTTEHFENCLAMELSQLDPSKPIWVEDESRMIGLCNIPKPFYQKMQQAPLYLLETSLEERIEKLIKDYGSLDKDILISSVQKISKKLGGARTKEVIQYIENSVLEKAVALLLTYYDSAYQHSLKKRKNFSKLST